MQVISGACLCGALRYEVDALDDELTHCHCAACRKHHGAPFATFVTAAPAAFRWRAGESSVRRASAERASCATCGSVAPTVVDHRVPIPAGNLVGDLGTTRGRHVMVADKPAWHVIADALPQAQGAPVGWHAAEPIRGRASSTSDVHGSCLCGAVTFAVAGAPTRWMQCHCSRCRRARSAAHGSNTFVAAAQFAWRSGRELVASHQPADAARFTTSFCTACGGGAPSERAGVPFVLVPASLLDGDLPGGPEAHIHVASRAPWMVLDDTLPKFDELPPA